MKKQQGSMKPWDAIVLGSGIAGLGVARALVLRKKKVLVLEKKVVGESSSHASGILDPFVDLDFRPEILDLTIPAVKKYPEWIRQIESATGLSAGYKKYNLVYLAFTKSEEKKLRQFLHIPGVKKRMRVDWLSPCAILKLESGISPRVLGGLSLRGVARILPAQLLPVLREFLLKQGVVFKTISQDPRLIVEKGKTIGIALGSRSLRATNVVACLGAWAGQCDKSSGFQEPVEFVRGQVLIYPRKKPLKILLHTADGGYLIPWQQGSVLAGSTIEKVGSDAHVTRAGAKIIKRYASRLLPEMEKITPTQTWAGLRPRSLTGSPIIGKTNVSGYYVANGYYRCGILIGIYAGELLVQLMQSGRVPDQLRPFSPENQA